MVHSASYTTLSVEDQKVTVVTDEAVVSSSTEAATQSMPKPLVYYFDPQRYRQLVKGQIPLRSNLAKESTSTQAAHDAARQQRKAVHFSDQDGYTLSMVRIYDKDKQVACTRTGKSSTAKDTSGHSALKSGMATSGFGRIALFALSRICFSLIIGHTAVEPLGYRTVAAENSVKYVLLWHLDLSNTISPRTTLGELMTLPGPPVGWGGECPFPHSLPVESTLSASRFLRLRSASATGLSSVYADQLLRV